MLKIIQLEGENNAEAENLTNVTEMGREEDMSKPKLKLLA